VIPHKAERIAYGDDASQFVELWVAAGDATLTLVMFHGGFWRAAYDLGLMDGLCADTAQRGWRAVNVEYRRGQGWTAMAEDVVAAWALAVELSGDDPIVTVGHSAGGHLALWAAAKCAPKPAAVVSLAGVADLGEARRLDLGGGAVDELLDNDARVAADPVELLPTGVPTLLVAPQHDTSVPRSLSASYAGRARALGDQATLIEPAGDHMAVLDPSSDAWAATVAHIIELVAER
jgi:acetyl esterase/lipase